MPEVSNTDATGISCACQISAVSLKALVVACTFMIGTLAIESASRIAVAEADGAKPHTAAAAGACCSTMLEPNELAKESSVILDGAAFFAAGAGDSSRPRRPACP